MTPIQEPMIIDENMDEEEVEIQEIIDFDFETVMNAGGMAVKQSYKVVFKEEGLPTQWISAGDLSEYVIDSFWKKMDDFSAAVEKRRIMEAGGWALERGNCDAPRKRRAHDNDDGPEKKRGKKA